MSREVRQLSADRFFRSGRELKADPRRRDGLKKARRHAKAVAQWKGRA